MPGKHNRNFLNVAIISREKNFAHIIPQKLKHNQRTMIKICRVRAKPNKAKKTQMFQNQVEKLDVVLCGRKDNSLFGRFDDVLQQMKQNGCFIITTTLKKRQLCTQKRLDIMAEWNMHSLCALYIKMCRRSYQLYSFSLPENLQRPLGRHRITWLKNTCGFQKSKNWYGSESSTLEIHCLCLAQCTHNAGCPKRRRSV